MRIVILANRDIASLLAINYLLRQQRAHHYSIFLSKTVGAKLNRLAALEDLAFFEQKLFFDVFFPALDATLAHRARTKNSEILKNFEQLQQQGIAVSNIDDINSPSELSKIAGLKPNLIVSIRFGQILQQRIIDVPEFGVLNLHSGLLPEYRGVMATFWAMLNKERYIGSTLHYITDCNIDAGKIVSRQPQTLHYEQSYFSNVISLYQPGAKAISNAIDTLVSGQSLATTPADLNKGHYYSFPTQDDLAAFMHAGYSLVNHNCASQITRQFY